MINEEKSISEFTVNVSNGIINKIIGDVKSDNDNKSIGEYSKIEFVKGDFQFNINNTNLDTLNVNYEVYFCKNQMEYNFLLNAHVLDCMADNKNNTINISMAYINDELMNDFMDDIYHEVNHLFQYSMGFAKNETIYDTCVKIIKNPNIETRIKSPAYTIYFTFTHEQDSFTHQFYSYLNRMYENESIPEFDEAINSFQIYKSLINSYRMTKDNFNDKRIEDTISSLGLSKNKWDKISINGINRLKRKLRHAYDKFKFDKRRKNIRTESVILEQIKYGDKLKTEFFLDM